jgi:hypothetical protein
LLLLTVTATATATATAQMWWTTLVILIVHRTRRDRVGGRDVLVLGNRAHTSSSRGVIRQKVVSVCSENKGKQARFSMKFRMA